jgi:hypothetical protein
MCFVRSICNLLRLATLAVWLVSGVAVAAVGDEPLPNLLGQLREMSPIERDDVLRKMSEEIQQAPPEVREQKRQWMKDQWVALTPEQRQQLRSQIRDHWQRISPDQHPQFREERRDTSGQTSEYIAPRPDEGRAPRLSPEDRQQFRDWLRERNLGGVSPPP